MPPANDSPTSQLLLEHTAWMRRLAASLVGDGTRTADADDIVQQACLQVVRQPPAATDSIRSWLRVVVRNVVFRAHRDESRRRRREHVAARPERSAWTPDKALERLELQREIAGMVLELREPYRSTLILHFFEERPAREIAELEGIAEATVRSRLQRAIEQLRARLDRSHGARLGGWQAALAPLVLPELAPLGAAAGGAAGAASGAAAGATTTMLSGALLMTQKTLVAAVVASILVLAVGVGVWKASTSSTTTALPPAPTVEESPQYRAIARRLEEQSARLVSIRRERDELAAANQALERELTTAQELAAASALAESGATSAAQVADGVTIQWDEFASLLADSFELLVKLSAGDRLTPDEEAQLELLRGELTKVAARAKTLYAEPLFEPSLLGDLARSAFARPLGLDAEQVAALDALTSAISAALPEDAATLPPLDKYALRKDLQDALFGGIEELLTEEQLERWPTLREWTEDTLRYGGDMTFGIDGTTSNFLQNWVSNGLRAPWASLATDAMTPHAEAFLQGARELLSRYGSTNDALRDLPAEQRALLDAELLGLQRQFLDRVDSVLTEEQREEARAQDPLIIDFQYGGGVMVRGRGRLF